MSPIAPFLAPDRDEAAKVGRAKGASITFVGLPGVVPSSTVSTTWGPGLNTDSYSEFFVQSPVIVDQLLAQVTTNLAATNFRMGIYRASRDYQPQGAPLVDSGDVSAATTGIKTYTPGTPVYLARGRYLTVHNCDSNTLRFAAITANLATAGAWADETSIQLMRLYMYVLRTYAAFPTPGTAWDTVAGSSGSGRGYPIWLRVSKP